MRTAVLIILTLSLMACSNIQKQSLIGNFQGSLPCLDCNKIDAKLSLRPNNNYVYYKTYFLKNKEQHPFIERGKYVVDSQRNLIRLNNSDSLALFIGENYLEITAPNGKRSKNGQNYRLYKANSK